MNCIVYHKALEEEWNGFVAESKNGTFLMDRRYMDYHSARYADHSLLFYDDKGLTAVLPAHIVGETLCSHRGLTYGGLVMGDRCTATGVCAIFATLNEHLRREGIGRVEYAPPPHIYHRYPSDEDLYGLYRVCHSRLVRRDISTTIVPTTPLRWNRDRRYAANKARTDGITVEHSEAFDVFWPILTDNLLRTHGVTPVHRLDEMELLHKRFPGQIRLYLARKRDGTPLAGTVLYVTPQVAHAQYISATAEGKRLHAVDALYDRIIRHDFACHPYIDFGKSTEGDGTVLNETLIYQKEGFGGRAVCYDRYEWDIER